MYVTPIKEFTIKPKDRDQGSIISNNGWSKKRF